MVSSTPRPRFTLGKDPVPILQEAGRAPGPVWTGGKSRPHRNSIPDRPARSQSLYRLCYRAHDLYSLPNIIGTNRLKIIKWSGLVVCKEQGRCTQSFGGGNLRQKEHLENLGIDGRIILQRVFKKRGGGYRLDSCGSG